MSGVKVERPGHLDLSRKRVSFDDRSRHDHSPMLTPSPKKIKLDPEVRPRHAHSRRRTHSCSILTERKRRQVVVIPTKFLLGGNITDPLNLEACGDGDLRKDPEPGNRGGGTVKVIIPPNINDPLNLDACSEDGEEQLADAIHRQRRRRKGRVRKRRRRNSEPTSGAVRIPSDTNMSASVEENLCEIGSQPILRLEAIDVSKKPIAPLRQISCPAAPEGNGCSQQQTATHSKQNQSKRWRPKGNRIVVSPVVKQPGSQLWHYTPNDKPPHAAQINSPKSYNPKNAIYQYGNYNQYYGYRNPDNGTDPRLNYFQRVWFEGKDVLDIGCNIGHISYLVARDFRAKQVTGIDIDKKLIAVANKNLKHYLPDGEVEQARFPKSMRTMYGRLKPIAFQKGVTGFPYNVRFFQNNYVLEADELLDTIREEFDCVLCLSVTKWIHLNFGDNGLKRFFSRIYRNLRPDGLLILEPQAWPSYKKKRKLTERTFETYKSIKFFPNQFEEFLTKTLGMFHVHTFRVDHTISKGFHRVLCVYRKPTDAERKVTSKTCTLDKSSQTEEYSAPVPSPTRRDDPIPAAEVLEPVEGSANKDCNSPATVRDGQAQSKESSTINQPVGEVSPGNNSTDGTQFISGSQQSSSEVVSLAVASNGSVLLGQNSSNSPTVGSTTDDLPRAPTPCLETSTCDSTTDEVDQSSVQAPLDSPPPPQDKS